MDMKGIDWEKIGEEVAQGIRTSRIKDILWTKEQLDFLMSVFETIGKPDALEEVMKDWFFIEKIVLVDGDLYLVRENETSEDVRKRLTRSGFME